MVMVVNQLVVPLMSQLVKQTATLVTFMVVDIIYWRLEMLVRVDLVLQSVSKFAGKGV
tara:strand:- start:995 stop:1168 length:174 start_codon:yes stop_codon:yes gene_type:complete